MSWFSDPADMAAVNEIMLEIIHPTIIDQINRDVQIYSVLRRQTPELKGKKWELANEIGHNEGIGFVGESEELPTPNPQSYARTELAPKSLYGRMFVSGHAMEKTGSGYGSLADALLSEMKGLVRDFKYEFGRIFFGNGRGILGRGVAATNITLHSTPTNVDIQDSWGITSGDPRPARLFRVGMQIASVIGGAITGIGVVTDIVDANTIEVSLHNVGGGTIGNGAAACDLVRNNDDLAMALGNTGFGTISTDYTHQREAWGLQNVVNSNAYMGVNGENWWTSYQADMSGATIGEEDIQESLDEVDILSGEEPGYHMTSHFIRRGLANAMVADRRYVNTMTYQGGWKAIEICGHPVFADRHCPVDMYFGLSLGELATCQTRDPFWIDDDGAILHRRENYHQFQAVMAYFFNLRAFTRNTHFRLYNAACT